MNAQPIEKEKIETIKKEMNSEFRDHMIPFWKCMRDEENGGYYGSET